MFECQVKLLVREKRGLDKFASQERAVPLDLTLIPCSKRLAELLARRQVTFHACSTKRASLRAEGSRYYAWSYDKDLAQSGGYYPGGSLLVYSMPVYLIQNLCLIQLCMIQAAACQIPNPNPFVLPREGYVSPP